MLFIKLAPKRFGASFCFIENRAISPLTGVLYFFAALREDERSMTRSGMTDVFDHKIVEIYVFDKI